jgi:hypothetical protein
MWRYRTPRGTASVLEKYFGQRINEVIQGDSAKQYLLPEYEQIFHHKFPSKSELLSEADGVFPQLSHKMEMVDSF